MTASDAAMDFVEEFLWAERERARAALLAQGMPPAQIRQLLDEAAAMHARQLAMIERVTSGASVH
jgi:DNA-binding transcriptional regulator YdaS (Cro superfamily)